MTPYYQDASVTLYHGDACYLLREISEVDHVLADPPYSAHVHSNVATRWTVGRARSKPKTLGFEPISEAERWWVSAQLARIVKQWCLIFSDVESSHLWQACLTASGVLTHVRQGHWVKTNAPPQFSGDRPASAVEAISILHPHGRKRWQGGGKHAVWSYPVVRASKGSPRLHAAQKPVALVVELLHLFARAGDVILDPFAGSGTTGVAAKMAGMKAILIEKSEQHCEVIAQRISRDTAHEDAHVHADGDARDDARTAA